ncbi:MAG: tetratricopeptide repeat protein [Mastigocoleus sp. MO_167.B18]|nr:tetratricopeptide repeat protein [Mastigocoleus sp. MO_167.B18]
MNEQRQTAYFKLIQELMGRSITEQEEILQSNLDLLDAEFLQFVEAVAEMMSNKGYEDTADWLRNLSNDLAQTLHLKHIPLQVEKFVTEVLWTIADSNKNVEVIYPLLAANTDKLDLIFADVLRDWATSKFAEANKDEAQYMAEIIFYFAGLIRDFPLGDTANKVEIAIACYETLSKELVNHTFQQPWATVQHNLGIAYSDRIKGDKAENIENAIASYNAALQFYNIEAFPQEWATAQNNLGNVYSKRIKGNQAENIETAISYYDAALQVRTLQDFPQDWAQTQNNLGIAYSYRIKGDRWENIERAISCCNAALQVYTIEAFPQEWGTTQSNLANAYRRRIKGDKADNLENAINICQSILQVYTHETFPVAWAMTQHNLGAVYSERIKGDTAENIENAISCYQAALQVRTPQTLPQDWSQTKNNLGNAYSQRIKGDRAENIENAISYYQAALQVITQATLPQDWAQTQNNLGAAYYYRIKGNKAENIENTISYYQAALQIYTHEDFPEDWAQTQNNLGTAYGQRIDGNKAENIENAISCYKAALQVRTQITLPHDWAQTQNNLGTAYNYRIKGDLAENIENAISCYQAALQIITQATLPQDWATTQNNLAAAYNHRIKGDTAENIENAVFYHKEALQVYTQQAFPQGWAMTQINLGSAYSDRVKGNKADNIETAIFCYQAALQVYTQQAFPQEWAMTQNSLGVAYNYRINEDKAENIEVAIKAFQQALQIRTLKNFPQQWANTQNDLAAAYSNRIKGNKTENIENAISCYEAALQIYTHENFPQHWAMIQNNLGIAYGNRIKGDKTENTENAIKAFQQALQVHTRQKLPQNNVLTLFNLGNAYQNIGRLNLAYTNYESAIATLELLRGEIISGEESKRKQAEEWNKLYRRMVEVCLELEEISLALEYIERSKNRNLVELILERDNRKTIFPVEIVTQLEQLRDEIAEGQYKIQNGKVENPTVLAQHLQELRQQQNNLQNNYLPVGSGFNFEKFQATLDQNTAVIEWYITRTGWEAFVISCNQIQRLKSLTSNNNLQVLGDWTTEYLRAYYYNKNQWVNSLASRFSRLAEILRVEELLQLLPNNCSRLVLIPITGLHLFPLHTLPLSDGSFLYEKFSNGVSYAPSCQLLQQINLRQRPNFKSLFAIQNPTEDLDYTDLEVETISSLFTDTQVLSRKQATQTALSQASSQIQQANYLHFSCHGTFNLKVPQDSCLLLAGGYENGKLDLNKCLTLGNLFERDFNLNQCRLVVLSACETGLIDFNNDSDEYIGLPGAFLYAGSSNVVSSLWTVNDLSTSFLIIKFIQNLKSVENISVSVALNQAQTWLRNITKEALQKWTNDLPLDATRKGKIRRQLRKIDLEKPFNSPFHWAAFTAIGR